MAQKKTAPTLLATRRFVKDYRKANATIRDGARRKANALMGSALRDPEWLHQHDKVEGLGKGLRCMELEIGSGPRLVAYVDGMVITLVALGPHDVVTHLKRNRNVREELKELADLPAGFGVRTLEDVLLADMISHLASKSGTRDPRLPFGLEVDPNWLHFLSDEQEEMFLGIAGAIENALTIPGMTTAHFIEGGPGTGKTSVLLCLLDHFAEEGYSVGLDMPKHLVEFVEAKSGLDLRKFMSPIGERESVCIYLVDDPVSLEGLRWDSARAKQNLGQWESTAVVVAFDPLQVEGTRVDELTDASLQKVRADADATRWVLRDCYRQKEIPGSAALSVTKVILGSSAFFIAKKRAEWAEGHAEITEAALNLRFINPGGEFTQFTEPEWSDWTGYLDKVGRETWATMREGDPRVWPRLAVVAPMDATLPESWAPPLRDMQHHFIAAHDCAERLRGVEYAHVAVLLTQSELERVTKGVNGTGPKEYERLRMLRLPFSRARDSTAVFVVPPGAP